MKKLITIALSALSCFSAAKAQSFDVSNVRFGLKAMVSLSFFTRDNGIFDKHAPGYALSPYAGYEADIRITGGLGLTANYELNNSFSFGAELNYNGRGGAFETENTNGTRSTLKETPAYDHVRFRIDYIEMPLMLFYKIPTNLDNGDMFVYGGIAPGVVARAGTNTVYYTGSGNAADLDTRSVSSPLTYVRGWNISPLAGIQIAAPGGRRFGGFSDIRFEYNFFPVFKGTATNGYSEQSGMLTISLGIGVRF